MFLPRFRLLLLIVSGLMAGLGGYEAFADAVKPNVVLILADDLGYGDLGCYGHPYARTPAIDQLAKEGTVFRSFHVTGVTCCPSRTGFMTSKFPATFHNYPANAGFGDRMTITELLKQAGYRTGHFGKWHMGPNDKSGTYGIDFVGSEEGSSRVFNDDRGRDANICDQAIKFVEENKDRPFYVNVWDHIPHFPVNPPQKYVDKFKDLVVKESDFAPTMKEKFDLVKKAGGDVSQCMRNFVAELQSMDDSIARLLAKIDELGLRDKTIVVFSSDQGAAPVRIPAEAGGEQSKGNAKQTKGEKAELRLNMLGYSGGLKGGKHNMYEGGVRVPFIIRWPGHVAAGRIDEKSVTSGIDWLPTLCHITGAKLPASDIDGEDVSDIWLGKSRPRTRPLFWKTSNPRSEVALLDGSWKLIWPGAKRGETELYDLANDVGETKNLAASKPDLIKTLVAKASAWNATLPKDYVKSNDKDNEK
jgi:N-acetylgalactosamine-6-sulfatase